MRATEHSLSSHSNLKAMHLNRLSLRFTGETAMLEAPFQAHFHTHNISQIRLALIMGALMYAFFGILDALVLPQHKHITWLIRYAFVCPAILAAMAATFFPWLHRYLQPILSFIVTFAGLGIILMVIVAPSPISYYYYAGLILVLMLGYSFVYIRFLWVSLSGWFLVILYEIAAVLTNTPALEMLSNSFFLVSANLAGMLICYTIEHANRRNYFLMQLLEREEHKIKKANDELEQRVTERTATLETMNRALTKEIAERRLAERERERLEIQLKQAEKMETIGKLASGVAHDLNNILSGLVSYPDLLLLEIPKNSRLHQGIALIQQSGIKAAAIVQDMLSLARQAAVEKKILNLNDVVNEYLRSPEYKESLSRHPRVRMEVDLQAALLNVKGSSVHLSKALMNLLHNAFEAIMVDGTVRILTYNRYLDQPLNALERIPEGEYAVLCIADTGIGIHKGDLDRIFEPFFTKKKLGRSGTGLGMTLVWSTVKDNGGFIAVETEEGMGSTFELYFPATRQEAPEKEKPFSPEDCVGSEKVLVIDDIPQQREIAAVMLGKMGYNVLTVPGGEAAIEYLRQEKVDILVLDMIMDPGIDGCETYRRILNLHPRQKAIIASGFSESERVREAQQLGAGPYIRKPYSLENIARAVRIELDRHP
ncbi:MAG: response regulator [Smithellaceae bacterium]|nr:response regulator [Smithellaceae bacterium]